MPARSLLCVAVVAATSAVAPAVYADGSDTESAAEQAKDDSLDATEADDAELQSKRSHWNELDLKLLTMRIGGGALFDWATYEQDAASDAQMPVSAAIKLRDFRLLLKGKFSFLPRVSYTIGYMYDAPDQRWRFRQTGILIDLPELSGSLFVGRTKEGFSTNKLMVGYNGWTIERAAANDAFLPILADGVKWIGTGFGGRLVYNLGWFVDTLSENEAFNKNDKQLATRAVWLPFAKRRTESVLHIAAEARYGAADDGFLQFKAKPESFVAQSFAVDTGKFPASSTTMAGFELYYRPGPLMFGSEYFLNWVQSDQTQNPFFHGGEAFVSYLLTGEVRPYNEREAFFDGVTPKHPVSSNGIGAWELVLRVSYVDLDSGAIAGGKFMRVTPVVSWYLTKFMRLEAEYGYSRLDRDGLIGDTQYVQARLLLQLM
ncbi:MAG TPA: porin [Kofleriaceae bacterium]|jgi:phosphate-selective porin OprO/OprP